MPESSEKLTVKLEVDTTDATKELKAYQKKAEKDKVLKLQINSSKLKEQLAKANKDITKFRKEGNKDAVIVARIKADKLRSDIRTVNAEIRKVKKGFFGLNTIINDAVKAFLGFTVVRQIGRFFVNAVTGAAQFEETMAKVATLIQGDSTDAIKSYREQIIALSKEVPKTIDDLGGGLYQVLSAGITDASDAMQVLEVSSKAAVAGLTDTNTAVDAITTVLNAWNLSADQATTVADIFFTTIREGKTTFPELASAIGTVANSAALAGGTFEEVGAALATMTKAGISTDEAVTALNRLFLAIAKPQEGVRKKTEEMGVEFSIASLRAKGFGQFIKDVTGALGDDQDAIFGLGLGLREFKALSVIAGTGAEEFSAQLDNMINSSGAADEAFQKMNATAKNQVQLFRNELTASMLTLADTVMPSLTSAMNDSRESVGGLTKFLTILGATFTTVFEFIRTGFDALSSYIATFVIKVKGAAEDVPSFLKVIWNSFTEAIEGGVNIVVDKINKLLKFVSDAINKISAGFADVNLQINNISLEGVRFNADSLFQGTKKATAAAKIVMEDFANRSVKGLDRIKKAWGNVNNAIIGKGVTGDAVKKAKDIQEALSKIGKTSGSGTTKSIDEFQKKVDETYTEIEKIRASDQKSLENVRKYYAKEIGAINKSIKSLETSYESASENIRKNIRKNEDDLSSLTKSYEESGKSAEEAFSGNVASRVIELKKEFKDLKEQIKLANEEQRSEDIPALVARQKEVQKLLSESSKLTTSKDITEAKRVAGLSEFELLKEQFDKEKAEKDKQFEEDKARLEEQKAINETFLIENNDQRLKGLELYAENAKDIENQRLAEDLLQQETARLTELESNQKQLEALESQAEIADKKALARTQRTTAKLVQYWNAVKRAKEDAIGAAKAEITESIGLLQTEGGVAGSTTTNTQNVKINQNISSAIDTEAANREFLRRTQPI